MDQILTAFDTLSENDKTTLVLNLMASCNIDDLSFKIGKKYGFRSTYSKSSTDASLLRADPMQRGIFEAILTDLTENKPGDTVSYWPMTQYDDLNDRFTEIMMKYGYTVTNKTCQMVFGDWGQLDNKIPHESEYPCIFRLRYKDYLCKDGDEEWLITDGLMAVDEEKHKESMALEIDNFYRKTTTTDSNRMIRDWFTCANMNWSIYMEKELYRYINLLADEHSRMILCQKMEELERISVSEENFLDVCTCSRKSRHV